MSIFKKSPRKDYHFESLPTIDNYMNLNADEVQSHINDIMHNKEKFKSDIHPFEHIQKRKDIRYKLEKECDTWYLRIY